VDFVVFRNNRVEQLIQVCADAENPKTEAREIRGLLKASRALGCENLLLLTESERGQQRETWLGIAAEIRRMPISDWLIEN
jgi:predicted AAA+ superfamily ATPase